MQNFHHARPERPRIPFAIKLAYTAYLAILIPVYLRAYGPTNFLWFCDTALLLTGAALWLESSLLISMAAVGILIPQFLWLAVFAGRLFGIRILGLTDYMFDPAIPLFTRALSLFHGWLPLLLIWLLRRVGYDRRALLPWGATAALLITVCYLFTPPAGVHPADPNIPVNINDIYGFDAEHPQNWMDQRVYLLCWLGVLWIAAYLPAHLALKNLFPSPPAKPHRDWHIAGPASVRSRNG